MHFSHIKSKRFNLALRENCMRMESFMNGKVSIYKVLSHKLFLLKRKMFEEDRATWLKHQFLNMTFTEQMRTHNVISECKSLPTLVR